MTAPDMVSVIAAALAGHDTWVPDTEHSAVVCDECGWAIYSKWDDPSAEQTTAQRKYAHQARAVLAAISEAGAVEWGVQLSESFMENHHGSRRGADEAAKETGSHVITRVTLPWERAE